MRCPPHPLLLPAYPVAGGTCLLAVLATLAYWSGRFDVAPLMETSATWPDEPWRLLTSTLLHGDLLHLAFNVYWTWTFGTLLEEELGHAKTAGLFLLFAAGSSAAEFAVFDGGIGLSGVGYGLFGFLWIAGRRAGSPYYEVVDGRTARLFLAWFVICLLSPRIANVAHGADLVLGCLLGAAAYGRNEWRLPAAGLLALSLAAIGLALGPGRPYVNFSRYAGEDLALAAAAAYEEQEYSAAANLLERAVKLKPGNADWWHDLGLNYEHLGRNADALAAYERAVSLAPADQEFAEARRRVRDRLREERRGEKRSEAETKPGK